MSRKNDTKDRLDKLWDGLQPLRLFGFKQYKKLLRVNYKLLRRGRNYLVQLVHHAE